MSKSFIAICLSTLIAGPTIVIFTVSGILPASSSPSQFTNTSHIKVGLEISRSNATHTFSHDDDAALVSQDLPIVPPRLQASRGGNGESSSSTERSTRGASDDGKSGSSSDTSGDYACTAAGSSFSSPGGLSGSSSSSSNSSESGGSLLSGGVAVAGGGAAVISGSSTGVTQRSAAAAATGARVPNSWSLLALALLVILFVQGIPGVVAEHPSEIDGSKIVLDIGNVVPPRFDEEHLSLIEELNKEIQLSMEEKTKNASAANFNKPSFSRTKSQRIILLDRRIHELGNMVVRRQKKDCTRKNADEIAHTSVNETQDNDATLLNLEKTEWSGPHCPCNGESISAGSIKSSGVLEKRIALGECGCTVRSSPISAGTSTTMPNWYASSVLFVGVGVLYLGV